MLKVGTDCSGIDAPIQALKNLEIPFEHIFSCESDKFCRQTIEANCEVKTIYENILTRNIEDVPYVDLYVCGFPCQPFSSANGRRQGIQDARGTIVHSCIEYIREKRPRYFVLENVRGLMTIDKGETFRCILSELRSIDGYVVNYRLLNTKDFGIPQNRPRVYIIGIYTGTVKQLDTIFDSIEASKKIVRPLTDYIDHSNTQPGLYNAKLQALIDKVPSDAVFIETQFYGTTKARYPNSGTIAPCLLASGRMYNVVYKRKVTVKECLMLQGFPADFKQVVSDFQIKKQIGNSMSVCVLEAIFKSLLIETE
jgi:DNA (cytosine-5)-methyltransferase 1